MVDGRVVGDRIYCTIFVQIYTVCFSCCVVLITTISYLLFIYSVQYWKFAVTGADGNRELKVWSCETWTCLQTLRFMPHPDIPSNFQMEPCLKSCFDLSASYLVLSDVNRRVSQIIIALS